MRTVAQVDADQLRAAAAFAKVLRAPQQGGGRRREREDARDGLHLLARLPIDVDAVDLGLGQGLAARGRGAESIDLPFVQGGGTLSGGAVRMGR